MIESTFFFQSRLASVRLSKKFLEGNCYMRVQCNKLSYWGLEGVGKILPLPLLVMSKSTLCNVALSTLGMGKEGDPL